MSYETKFKGKLVWGTSIWRILLETNDTNLKSDFTGNLTLFERRHEVKTAKFSSLDEFIANTRSMWKESLRAASVQDTRFARWIEEYLTEKEIDVSYNEVLQAVRGEFKEVPPLEVEEPTTLEFDQVNEIFPEPEDVMVEGSNRKITGEIGDPKELEEILSNYLQENKPERNFIATSKVTFILGNGQEQTVNETIEIEDHVLDEGSILQTGFYNNYGEVLSDINIVDKIPYDFNVEDVSILGPDIDKEDKEKTESGLNYEFHIDKLQPGERVTVEYDLSKRMLRTILIRDDRDLTILQTYETIEKDNNSVWIESSYTFHDKTPIVENVKILDQIPSDYKFISSQPEAKKPRAQTRITNTSTEITWSYTEVPAQTQFLVVYELEIVQKILRDKVSLINSNDEHIADFTRVIKDGKQEKKFGVIMAVRALKDISHEIKLVEILPESYEVIEKKVEHGKIKIINENENKKVIWETPDIEKNNNLMIFLEYQGEGYEKFDQLVLTKTSGELIEGQEKAPVTKSESIVLPKQIRET